MTRFGIVLRVHLVFDKNLSQLVQKKLIRIIYVVSKGQIMKKIKQYGHNEAVTTSNRLEG